MIVYHGSVDIIDSPIWGKGRPSNDFGCGFYCAESVDLAKEWACAKGSDGFVSIYQLDLSGLKVLNLNAGNDGILVCCSGTISFLLGKWKHFGRSNGLFAKAFFVLPSEYDVVHGYRADGSYFTFAKSFVSNEISLEHLREALHFGTLGEQIVLKSPKAFSQITYIGNLPAKSKRYVKQARDRDREARRMYQELTRESTYSKGTFMLDIIREGMTASDPRLR